MVHETVTEDRRPKTRGNDDFDSGGRGGKLRHKATKVPQRCVHVWCTRG